MSKKILMIAGPNGAGKTTTALTMIAQSKEVYEFVNADEIAKGIAPLHPESVSLTASKLMIKRLRELLDINKSFAFETTAAGTNYLRYLTAAQKHGYDLYLIFLWLSSPEQAIERVIGRVAQGGHNIPHDTIKRRYKLGICNLIHYYLPLVDHAFIIDNSVMGKKRVIVRKNKENVQILDSNAWEKIKRSANVNR